MAKFVAGSLNLITVFYCSPIKRDLFFMCPLAVLCRIYGLDLPAFLGDYGLRGAKAGVSPPRRIPPCKNYVNIIYVGFARWHADLFSRHACPLERAVFLSWRSTKQVGTSYNTRYLVPGILQETSREIFSQSRRGSIVKERSFLLCLRLVFSFLFFIFSIVCLGICCVECPRGSGGR